MSVKRISDNVTKTVALGSGAYGATLVVTASGSVTPNKAGATGVLAPAGITAPLLFNLGLIQGGHGPGSGTGGIGVDLAVQGTVRNAGTIEAGQGGAGYYHGGNGGIAILFEAGGTFSNSGTIAGGHGGSSPSYYNYGGNGGVGVQLGDGTKAVNNGQITGGAGGRVYGSSDGGIYGFCGNGAAGIELGASTLINNGGIAGGAGGDARQAYGIKGYYTSYSGSGGDGVDLTSTGTLTNKGEIVGGRGGNTAAVRGYDHAGAGVVVNTGGSLANSGTIRGGSGGAVTDGSMAGGTGVALAAGTILTNTGTITGGAGGYSYRYNGGNGGAGVYLNGATLTTSGKIIGGAGGPGSAGRGALGDAVQFGSTAATLIVTAGATFNGNVAANTTANDILDLAGKSPGTLTGFGKTITGFTTISEEAHANWTLGGSISGSGMLTVGDHASLTLLGSVSIATLSFVGANGGAASIAAPTEFSSTVSGFGGGDVIDLAGLNAASLTYKDHTLTLFDTQGSLLDTINFAGSYTQSDFGLKTDGNGGTDVIFTGSHEQRLATAGMPMLERFGIFFTDWHGVGNMLER